MALKQVGKREKLPETAAQQFIYTDQVCQIVWKVYMQIYIFYLDESTYFTPSADNWGGQ